MDKLLLNKKNVLSRKYLFFRSTLEKAFELLPEDSEEGEDAGGQRPGEAGGVAAPRGEDENEGGGGGGVKKGGAGGHQAHFDDNY